MKRRIAIVILAVSSSLACVSAPPEAFTTSVEPGWSSIEVREDVERNRAWSTVYAILARNFDIEFASRQDGYLRTAWSHFWSDLHTPGYRVRVTMLLSEDGRVVQINPEAQYLRSERWVVGSDSRLVSTLKTDIMGTIGRTTR